MEVTVQEAKTQLSRLLKPAEEGETVTIPRRGKPAGGRPLGWDPGSVPDSATRLMTGEEAERFFRGT